MSLVQGLSQGSLFSDENLLQAREGYLPMPQSASADTAFEHWTKRLASQHELGVARELAGLSEEALAALAAVFTHVPRRQRTDRLRLAIPIGIALLLTGAFVLSLDASMPAPEGAVSPLRTLAIGFFSAGAIAIGLGVLAAFSMMPLDVAHGKLGLCTGLLDEHHPWLYKAAVAARDAGADAYRRHILAERGPLRGMDYLVMREIAGVNEALALTRVARTVAEELNQAGPATPTGPAREPRLASVPMVNTDRRRP